MTHQYFNRSDYPNQQSTRIVTVFCYLQAVWIMEDTLCWDNKCFFWVRYTVHYFRQLVIPIFFGCFGDTHYFVPKIPFCLQKNVSLKPRHISKIWVFKVSKTFWEITLFVKMSIFPKNGHNFARFRKNMDICILGSSSLWIPLFQWFSASLSCF